MVIVVAATAGSVTSNGLSAASLAKGGSGFKAASDLMSITQVSMLLFVVVTTLGNALAAYCELSLSAEQVTAGPQYSLVQP